MNRQSELALGMVMRNRMRSQSQPKPFNPQVTGFIVSDTEKINTHMTVIAEKRHRVGDSLILIKENRVDFAHLHLFRIVEQEPVKTGYSLTLQEEKLFINLCKKEQLLEELLSDMGGK